MSDDNVEIEEGCEVQITYESVHSGTEQTAMGTVRESSEMRLVVDGNEDEWIILREMAVYPRHPGDVHKNGTKVGEDAVIEPMDANK